MIIVLTGKAGVYKDGELMSELNENMSFGERSLRISELRKADLVAHTVTCVLVLTRDEFNEQVFHLEHQAKQQRQLYIAKMPFS